MILKSLARKEPTFGQLVAYFLAPEQKEIAVTQNFRIGTERPAAIIQEFEENYELLPQRKNGNTLLSRRRAQLTKAAFATIQRRNGRVPNRALPETGQSTVLRRRQS